MSDVKAVLVAVAVTLAIGIGIGLLIANKSGFFVMIRG